MKAATSLSLVVVAMKSNGFVESTAIPIVSVIPGGGAAGSTRVKIEFDNAAIRNTWLRITVLANANTDLDKDDVFYFGNAVGDFGIGNTGDPVTVRTNASDTSAVRQNQSTTPDSVGISNLYDMNKDGRVNASDTSAVRQNQLSNILSHITAPVILNFGSDEPVDGLTALVVRSKSNSHPSEGWNVWCPETKRSTSLDRSFQDSDKTSMTSPSAQFVLPATAGQGNVASARKRTQFSLNYPVYFWRMS